MLQKFKYEEYTLKLELFFRCRANVNKGDRDYLTRQYEITWYGNFFQFYYVRMIECFQNFDFSDRGNGEL